MDNSTCYIGEKGYTIPKKGVSHDTLESIRTELTLSPKESFGVKRMGNNAPPVQIPVYRENADKIYVPRFYGEQKYGLAGTSKLGQGDTINVPFTQTLRDYQETIVQTYIDHVGKTPGGGGGILEVPCGRGKTIMSLNIIHRMCKKTIILVHKEFLMNQWIERIRDFLPSARVGIIQGTKHDIENKDIVIAMIQTIYNRDYKLHAFSSFGLTIIDEVHRIGSEEFSKTLTKIVTPNMLGISATVDRKDGLTDILYMFIGPKIYHEERKDEDVVQVRGIQYEDPHDIDYNTVEYDFRGNVKFSTMITKISDHLPRCRFLVRIIKDLLEENDQNQIMVLSHTRNLLTYLHDEINAQQIGSCGYYVGGMKQVALQETEEKQIVLATYAMAAEALDIKTLNTLVMVSPKTDIVQSVGRILRTRGNGKIVVDVIDAHDLFQNQWKKRKTFYHKSNYQVRCISSLVYSGMRIDWENDTSWKLITGRRGKSAATTKTTKTKKGSQMEFEDDEEDAPVKCMIDLSQFTEENVV